MHLCSYHKDLDCLQPLSFHVRRSPMKHLHISFLLVLGWLVFVGLPGSLSAAGPYVLSVQQLKAGMEKSSQPSQKGFILVDVRTPEEHAGGFIPGTDFNIDFREMPFRHAELRAKLDEHIVVYCQSGHRSKYCGGNTRGSGLQICLQRGWQHERLAGGRLSY